MTGHLKRAARGLCPPAMWKLLGLCKRAFAPHQAPPAPATQWKTISTVAELDALLDRARAAYGVSFDAWTQLLDSVRFETPTDLPHDPASREYLDYQMAFYRLVSGREHYQTEVCEQLPVDEAKRRRPFPYYTGSTVVVSEQLMAIGYLIRASGVQAGERAVEFGPGFGRLTLELARLGVEVTAVEINPLYTELIRDQAQREDLPVQVVHAGMLEYQPRERFDRVFFYESFHHCADHAAMIARLDALVAPGGAAVFAGEPVCDDFPMPWGVRRDGRSLWAIRLAGWLELGFRTDYFLDLLRRHGWAVETHASADVPWQRVFVARRSAELPGADAAQAQR